LRLYDGWHLKKKRVIVLKELFGQHKDGISYEIGREDIDGIMEMAEEDSRAGDGR
jgi:hypothetical protein